MFIIINWEYLYIKLTTIHFVIPIYFLKLKTNKF